MITEDYVSFETAKLLKEKGFDGDVDLWFDENGATFFEMERDRVNDWSVRKGHKVYPHPTLQMAMKWLREVHNIFIAINMIPDIIQKHYFFKPYVGEKIYNFPLDYSVEFYTTYEEACMAAIKYCLENLI